MQDFDPAGGSEAPFDALADGAIASRLVTVVQKLSQARSIQEIQAIVKRAARALVGADGATFVLREGDCCFYADEDAISPLWKGLRFPMESCISGWAMLHREAVAITDIYEDPRIPVDAYAPTFVKSLVMVPIRQESPIGAIGAYWASTHRASNAEIRLLQILADTTAVAIENATLVTELEWRVRERTAELESINRELEAFSYSVSHDLRTPLTAIAGYAEILAEQFDDILPASGHQYLEGIQREVTRMGKRIADYLLLGQSRRTELHREEVDLTALVQELVAEQSALHPERRIKLRIDADLRAECDRSLIHGVLENLVSNAVKFSGDAPIAYLDVGRTEAVGEQVFYVRDRGVGFDMQDAERLFTPFERLATATPFAGTGVGLATVKRIIEHHGGRVWAHSAPGEGATFFFSLPESRLANP